jgi:hypothetical protein
MTGQRTWLIVFAAMMFGIVANLQADNKVLGEIQLHGTGKTEKLAGVWIDGQYVGYLKELNGSKKLLLLPGQHEITVRQAGYQDLKQTVLVEPGQKRVISVALDRDSSATYPSVTAEVKMHVQPKRAAVFVDGQFVGHVDEFDSIGQGLLVAPGVHHVRISLPGYLPFDTEIHLRENQNFELKTDLQKGSILQDGPPIRERASR